MRHLIGFLCVCALGLMPLVGCSDPEGDGGSGGAGGTAGAGGEFAVTRIVVAAEDTDPAIDDPVGGNHAHLRAVVGDAT